MDNGYPPQLPTPIINRGPLASNLNFKTNSAITIKNTSSIPFCLLPLGARTTHSACLPYCLTHSCHFAPPSPSPSPTPPPAKPSLPSNPFYSSILPPFRPFILPSFILPSLHPSLEFLPTTLLFFHSFMLSSFYPFNLSSFRPFIPPSFRPSVLSSFCQFILPFTSFFAHHRTKYRLNFLFIEI